MKTDFWIRTNDLVNVYVKKWSNASNKSPKAIVQIAHGMAEHIQRYDDFANFLIKQNIFVYGNDLRGHGKTGKQQGHLGFLSSEDGFAKTTNDLYQITRSIRKQYPEVPIFLYGHSMGSFLARKYIQHYSELIQGVILSGTGYFPIMTAKVGKTIASILPPQEQSNFMNSLTFRSYNKKVKNNNTRFDWLTRDEHEVQLYLDDPYAGFIPTARFFYDLMDGLTMIHHKKLNESIQTDLPMLIMSGDADPVGDYGKGVWKVAHHYDDIGIKEIITMIFEGGRHELLNEVNQEEVYQAIYQWINNRI